MKKRLLIIFLATTAACIFISILSTPFVIYYIGVPAWVELMVKIYLYLSIPIAVGLVILVRSKFNDNQKKFLLYSLWVFILIFSYLTYSSISDVIQFDEVKNYSIIILKQ